MSRITDPFERPQEVADPPAELLRAVGELLPAGMNPDTAVVLICVACDEEPSVRSSERGPSCLRCGKVVWLAPSSRTVPRDRLAPVCISCTLALWANDDR